MSTITPLIQPVYTHRFSGVCLNLHSVLPRGVGSFPFPIIRWVDHFWLRMYTCLGFGMTLSADTFCG